MRRYGNGGIDLRRKKPMPYVNHYTFHIWDRSGDTWPFACVAIRRSRPCSCSTATSTWPRRRQEGIDYRKEENCFTELADAPGLQKVADTLRSQDAIGRLAEVGERWLSRCLCFALDSDDQKRTGFRYALSLFQMEYSRNFLFKSGRVWSRSSKV